MNSLEILVRAGVRALFLLLWENLMDQLALSKACEINTVALHNCPRIVLRKMSTNKSSKRIFSFTHWLD